MAALRRLRQHIEYTKAPVTHLVGIFNSVKKVESVVSVIFVITLVAPALVSQAPYIPGSHRSAASPRIQHLPFAPVS